MRTIRSSCRVPSSTSGSAPGRPPPRSLAPGQSDKNALWLRGGTRPLIYATKRFLSDRPCAGSLVVARPSAAPWLPPSGHRQAGRPAVAVPPACRCPPVAFSGSGCALGSARPALRSAGRASRGASPAGRLPSLVLRPFGAWRRPAPCPVGAAGRRGYRRVRRRNKTPRLAATLSGGRPGAPRPPYSPRAKKA